MFLSEGAIPSAYVIMRIWNILFSETNIYVDSLIIISVFSSFLESFELLCYEYFIVGL